MDGVLKSAPHPELCRKLLRYDAEAGHLFWKHRPDSMFKSTRDANWWNSKYAGQRAFITQTRKGYLNGRLPGGRRFSAHRVAWAVHYGEWPSKQIDHINGDKTDNRIENLRDVTAQENQRNMGVSKRNKSGVVGVCRQAKKWGVFISRGGKQIRLGVFADFDEAVRVRRRAEKEIGYHPNHGKRFAA